MSLRCPDCGQIHEGPRCKPSFPTGYVPRVERAAPVEQPAPVANQNPAVWPLVMVDMASRDKLGRERYGTPLQPHNGRDTLRDAYEEALDLAVYLRSAIYERDGR
jgi:hypothetical protein